MPELPRRVQRAAAWLGPALLLTSLYLFYHGSMEWKQYRADDAYITFRYARNLAEGAGPVFNPGERVEGYSDPLWMFAMSGGIAAGLEPMWLARRLGIACALGLLLVLYLGLTDAGVSAVGAALTTFLLSLCHVIHPWVVSGMETLPYALLLFSGLVLLARPRPKERSAIGASLLLVLAALTRPEGVAFWGAGLVLFALTDRRLAIRYALPGILLLLHEAWRLSYYGDLLPNTFYAKTGISSDVLKSGVSEFRRFFAIPTHAAWAVLALAGGVFGARLGGQGRRVLVMGSATAFHLLYVVSIGGDSLLAFRYQVPVLAPMAFLVGLLFPRSAPGRVALVRAVGGAGLAAAVVYAALWAPTQPAGPIDKHWIAGNFKLGNHLAATRPPDTLIAVPAAGIIPYVSRLPTVDLYGLNDRHIAHRNLPDQFLGPGHMKWDTEYVLARQPDLIIINRGYFLPYETSIEAVRERPFALAMGAQEMDLFGHLVWNDDYDLRRLVFDDGSFFVVFERVAPHDSTRIGPD